jgi:hypothetical protein
VTKLIDQIRIGLLSGLVTDTNQWEEDCKVIAYAIKIAYPEFNRLEWLNQLFAEKGLH